MGDLMSMRQITGRVLMALLGGGMLTMIVGGAIGGLAGAKRLEGETMIRLAHLEAEQAVLAQEQAATEVCVDSLEIQLARQMGNYRLMNLKLDLLMEAQGLPVIRPE